MSFSDFIVNRVSYVQLLYEQNFATLLAHVIGLCFQMVILYTRQAMQPSARPMYRGEGHRYVLSCCAIVMYSQCACVCVWGGGGVRACVRVCSRCVGVRACVSGVCACFLP